MLVQDRDKQGEVMMPMVDMRIQANPVSMVNQIRGSIVKNLKIQKPCKMSKLERAKK